MGGWIQRGVHYYHKLEDVRPIAAGLMLIAVLIATINPDPVNKDGIIYLNAAHAFVDKGLGASIAVYGWPFYPILIALVSQLTHLSIEHAALALNFLFFPAIIIIFITALRELGADKGVQVLGAVILLSHPRVQHYHHYVLRDMGYWLFLLLSLVQMMRYYRRLNWRHALSWGVSVTIAALFRLEGFVLLCFAPIVLLLRNGTGMRERLGGLLKPYCFLLLLIILLVSASLFLPEGRSIPVGRLGEIWDQLISGLAMASDNLNAKAAIVSEQVLTRLSDSFGFTMIIGGLVCIYAYRFITTLYPLHTLLWAYGAGKGLFPDAGGRKNVVQAYILLSLVVPAVHLCQSFFMFPRFLMPAVLLLLLWVPFSVRHVIHLWQNRSKRPSALQQVMVALMAAWMVVMTVYVFIPKSGEDAYIVEGGIWLKTNMPVTARLYTNERKLSYYAQRKYRFYDAQGKRSKRRWKPGDYIALKVYPKNYAAVEKHLANKKLIPVKTISNRRGRRIVIATVPDT